MPFRKCVITVSCLETSQFIRFLNTLFNHFKACPWLKSNNMIISLSPRELPNCNILLWRPRPLTHILNIKALLTQNNCGACSCIVLSGVSGALSQVLQFTDYFEKNMACQFLVHFVMHQDISEFCYLEFMLWLKPYVTKEPDRN